MRQALERLPAGHAGRPRRRGQDAAGRRGRRRSAGRRDRRRARRDLDGRARVGHRRRRRAAGGARLDRPARVAPAAGRHAAGHQPRRADPAARGPRRRPRPARPGQLRAPHRRVRPPGRRAARAQPAAADRRHEQGAARHHRASRCSSSRRSTKTPPCALFADRAAAVSPDFTLDAETRPLVTDIVRRLDGLPLAIELAAARLRTLPLRRDLPAAGRPVPAAHRRQPHRAAAAPHAARRRRVELGAAHPATSGCSPSGSPSSRPGRPPRRSPRCARSAGLRLAVDARRRGEVDELLSSLVDKSLLQPLADGTRLRMLETIREYGAERLAGRGEVGELRRRHAAHYSALMAEAAPRLLTRDQLSWLAACAGRPRQHPRRAALLVRRGRRRERAQPGGVARIMALLLGNDAGHGGVDRRGPRGTGGRRPAACGPSPRRCTW